MLSSADRSHAQARVVFNRLAATENALTTTSYVLVETYALVTRRLGLEAARAVREKIAPLLDVLWVAESLHERGLDRFIHRGSRSFSLVDAVSFEVLTDQPAHAVFAAIGLGLVGEAGLWVAAASLGWALFRGRKALMDRILDQVPEFVWRHVRGERP